MRDEGLGDVAIVARSASCAQPSAFHRDAVGCIGTESGPLRMTNSTVSEPSAVSPAAPDLVDTAWLETRLGAPGLRVLDCTTWMTPQPVGPSRIDSGRPDWARAHIPDAVHVDMVEDLSDPHGRFPYTLPPPSRIAALLSRLGIGDEDHLVLYGASHPMVVTRAWWVLRTLGHARVSILDGGLEAWRREGRPLDDAQPVFAPARHGARLLPGRVADADDVARALADGTAHVVNALSEEQFRGAGGAHYGRPGRIPGSLSLPARDLIDPASGRWRSRSELERRIVTAGLPDSDSPVIVYCGGGIAATAVAFALHLVGRTRVAVYDNSLLEWSADPGRPMQLG
jgi:thiosulfate/3-mercaptopyruvate sulfurtransferase